MKWLNIYHARAQSCDFPNKSLLSDFVALARVQTFLAYRIELNFFICIERTNGIYTNKIIMNLLTDAKTCIWSGFFVCFTIIIYCIINSYFFREIEFIVNCNEFYIRV